MSDGDHKTIRQAMIGDILTYRPASTIQQIRQGLAEAGEINRETGNPWAVGTIHSDLEEIRAMWRQRATEGMDGVVGRELEKLDRVESQAWLQGRMDWVISAMQRRAKILGLDRPDRQEIAHTATGHLQVAGVIPTGDEFQAFWATYGSAIADECKRSAAAGQPGNNGGGHPSGGQPL